MNRSAFVENVKQESYDYADPGHDISDIPKTLCNIRMTDIPVNTARLSQLNQIANPDG
jgi:hypothetical protein